MFAVIFIRGNIFLRIAGKIAKLRTHKNFVPHRSKYRIWVLAGRSIRTLHKEKTQRSKARKPTVDTFTITNIINNFVPRVPYSTRPFKDR